MECQSPFFDMEFKVQITPDVSVCGQDALFGHDLKYSSKTKR